jgi:hypothetical protein
MSDCKCIVEDCSIAGEICPVATKMSGDSSNPHRTYYTYTGQLLCPKHYLVVQDWETDGRVVDGPCFDESFKGLIENSLSHKEVERDGPCNGRTLSSDYSEIESCLKLGLTRSDGRVLCWNCFDREIGFRWNSLKKQAEESLRLAEEESKPASDWQEPLPDSNPKEEPSESIPATEKDVVLPKETERQSSGWFGWIWPSQ